MIPAFQVIVVGAGHAGCEAALASARAGADTLLLTLNLDTIALMPCNPSVGGQGKGQLVREIDALGGEMGIVADETCIQARLLNTRKGLAVQSLRVQSDKYQYGRRMRRSLMNCPHLVVTQGLVTELLVENGAVRGVKTQAGDVYRAPAVVLAPGTFLRGLIHLGAVQYAAGRAGEPPAQALGSFLAETGFPVLRFKTGTPPRVDARSIDFAGLESQQHEPASPPFSLRSRGVSCLPSRPCHLTHTNRETHEIIARNFSLSALFSGRIHGTGPRYCPSIEDKVRKFPTKDAHKVFLEPEGADSAEIYLQGLSTSLPEEIQEQYVRSMKGLEQARLTRPGYAIEYDVVDPTHLRPTLECKGVDGLFLAGQVNGTSGYEEAGAQGLVAGINAAARVQGRPLVILAPEDSYTGLMIEEITTQGLTEPYRIFTSRSSQRLHLRMSNAEERLSALGHSAGQIPPDRWQLIQDRTAAISALVARLEDTRLPAARLNELFAAEPGITFAEGVSLAQALRRPEVLLDHLLPELPSLSGWDPLAKIEVEAKIKYAGYLQQQSRETMMVKEFQELPITAGVLADLPGSLSTESRQRIQAVRPGNIRELSRIPGLRASDVLVILMHLRRKEAGT